MTKVEIQVQNGKVTITVGGETSTYDATKANPGDQDVQPAQPQPDAAPPVTNTVGADSSTQAAATANPGDQGAQPAQAQPDAAPTVTNTVGAESSTQDPATANLGDRSAQAPQAQPSAAAPKKQAPTKPAESGVGTIVIGPLVIDESATGGTSGSGDPAADETKPGGGRPQGSCGLVIGPVVICGGRVSPARKERDE